MAIAPLGAGAIVCNVSTLGRSGASTPGWSGRCRATLVGAFIGAAAGLVPGALIIARSGSAPKLEDEYHDWVQTQTSGALLTLLVYTIGMPVGTIVGYNLGGVDSPKPATTLPVATAPIFTLRF